MITIHNIDETLLFYGSLGAEQKEIGNCTLFTFFDKTSYVRFWGDLHGFCVASVDVIFPKDIVFRSQIQQRYIGIGFTEEGQMISYNRKSEMRKSRNGIDCYVFNSPVPLFMKISGGQRLRFRGMYFQESFFRENNVALYDSFWEDAKRSLAFNELHSPELLSIYQRIEKCPLTGEAFHLWMRGQGLAAAGYLMNLVQSYTSAPPVYLSEDEIEAVLQAKRLIKEHIDNVPTILDLCKSVALNKNKLQKAFQLTEGKSIGEYIRTLRVECALELLEKSDMSTNEIAKAVGYHGVSNFYHVFQQRFGETPQTVRELLQKNRANIF